MPPKDEQIFEANCGTGKGGFQPGNTCAKGGDDSDDAIADEDIAGLPENVRVSYSGGDFEDGAEAIKDFFGRDVSAQEFAAIVGAMDGSKVSVLHGNGPNWRESFYVFVEHKDVTEQFRKIRKIDGQIVIDNVNFEAAGDAPAGFGTRSLVRQATWAQKLGVSQIETYAAGSGYKKGEANGYYTWPRLGYNAPLTEDDQFNLGGKFNDAKDLHSLFSKTGGAEAWKEYGSGRGMTFDLRKGSESVKRLKAYVAKKRADKVFAETGKAEELTPEQKDYWKAQAELADAEHKRRIAIGEPGDTPDDLDELDEANMAVIQTASEPGQAAVHVPAPMGGGKKTAKKKTPNSHFMQRMMVSMMERYSEEEIAAFKKTAAAHAGGMTKAERAKLACMQNELYKESLPADEDDDIEMAENCGTGKGGFAPGNTCAKDNKDGAVTETAAQEFSKGGKYEGQVFFHQTRSEDFDSIEKSGLSPSDKIYGSGVYLTSKTGGVSGTLSHNDLEFRVYTNVKNPAEVQGVSGLGKLMDSLGAKDNDTPESFLPTKGYDSIHITGKNGNQLVVFNPKNTTVVRQRLNDAARVKEKLKDKRMSEGDESLTAMLREIETAFRTWAQIPNQKPGEWPDCKYWCREVFSDYVIAEDCKTSKLCKIPFQENTADGYDFGVPVEVEISYVPVTASEVGDLCADGNGWRLFVEHDFAEAPDWMPLLPKPGKYKHPKYGEIKLTKARNANFADGVNKKIYQSSLPINTEHAPSNEGAFGWIEEARQNDDGSIDARVSWTDLGKEAIEKDRFRFISPEWADECESPDGKKLTDVIRGAAMTVRPFFKDKHLRPLVASERGLETLDHALPASDQPQLFFFTALLPSEPASQPGIQTYKEPTPMAEKEKIETPEVPVEKPAATIVKAAETPAVDALKFAELETKLQALEAENMANKQAAEIQASEVKKLSEANAKLTDEAETLKFTEEVEGKSKANKHAYVGEFAKHVAHMKSLAKAFGEDSEEIKFYMETQRQSAALAESSLLFAEKGRGGAGGDGTPWGKIVGIAKTKVEADKTLSEAQAISLVLKEQPELYAEYQASEGN